MLANALILTAAMYFADPVEPPPEAAHQPLHVQIWEGYYHSKINLRYHLAEAARWGWWNRTSTGATLLLALLSLTGPLVYSRAKLRWIWVAVGIVAFSLSVSQFIWPFGHWYSEDTVLAGRWNQMANDWYALYEAEPDLEEKQIKDRIVLLRKEVVHVENDQDASRYDSEAMAAAERAENMFQGLKAEPHPEPERQAAS